MVLKLVRWGRLISVPLISSLTCFFMKLVQTNNTDIIKSCQSYFSFQLPSDVLSKRVAKFNMKFKNHQNQLCRMINNLWSYCDGKYSRKSCQYFLTLIHCLVTFMYLRQRRRYMFSPARPSSYCLSVCLSVCLCARLIKNACMVLDEMLRVDICRDMDELINFWARSGS